MPVLTTLLAFACLVWGGSLLSAFRRRADPRHRVGPTTAGPATAVKVRVIVPARDEEANIGTCLAHLAAQTAHGDPSIDLGVVVLDDGSTDRTAELLSAAGAPWLTVLQGGEGPLPPGWLGKPWACQRAGEAAAADMEGVTHGDGVAHGDGVEAPCFLLFIDADVRLAPAAVVAAVGHVQRSGLDLLSGFGSLELHSFWEKVMQPAVSGLILAGNDPARVNDPDKRRGPPLANGQFMCFSLSGWQALGGHGAVRANVLDDVGMATAVTEAGLAYELVHMREIFACRMYDGFASLWSGWTKNLFAGMGRSWPMALALVAFTLLLSVLPSVVLFAALFGWLPAGVGLWAGLAVALSQGLRFYLDGVFGQERRYGLTAPLAALLLAGLILNSAIQDTWGTRTWKGRTLPSEVKGG